MNSDITLGHVWYFMIYLSDNPTIKFWGWVDMMLNSGAFILFFIPFMMVISIIMMLLLDSFKISRGFSLAIGIIISYFLFFGVVVKQSGDMTTYSWELAKNLYITDKDKFNGYEPFSKTLK